MFSRQQKLVLLKMFSLFSVVRGYNILVIVIAMYLASVYIFANDKSLSVVLFDPNLLMLVLASAATIAAGYIINNFYDSEKDLINRPQKSMIERLVSQNTKLFFYFVLNFLALIFASYVSFSAVVFFGLYILGIWMYSHRLKKMPMTGNVISALLTVTPFFAIFIYYQNFQTVVFMHAIFLFLLISMKELVKDLENIKGDLALDYRTVPVVYGEQISKWMFTVTCVLTIFAALALINFFEIGKMYYYFYGSILLLLLLLFLLWRSQGRYQYLWVHNILKVIIVMGIASILLIDTSVVLNRIL
jgi:4-hydroxybenzoate polyprenyltransferase